MRKGYWGPHRKNSKYGDVVGRTKGERCENKHIRYSENHEKKEN